MSAQRKHKPELIKHIPYQNRIKAISGALDESLKECCFSCNPNLRGSWQASNMTLAWPKHELQAALARRYLATLLTLQWVLTIADATNLVNTPRGGGWGKNRNRLITQTSQQPHIGCRNTTYPSSNWRVSRAATWNVPKNNGPSSRCFGITANTLGILCRSMQYIGMNSYCYHVEGCLRYLL